MMKLGFPQRRSLFVSRAHCLRGEPILYRSRQSHRHYLASVTETEMAFVFHGSKIRLLLAEVGGETI